MLKTKVMIIPLLFILPTFGYSQSNCFGSDLFKTCTDQSGNTYQIQKFGNSTYVNGSNPNTGSQWNQQTQKIGNTTFHQGQAGNGQSWNITEQNFGGTKFISGQDSKGNFISCQQSKFLDTCKK
jgi:hypothetical protein